VAALASVTFQGHHRSRGLINHMRFPISPPLLLYTLFTIFHRRTFCLLNFKGSQLWNRLPKYLII